MIEINTVGTWGFEGALRGCRMPYESFDKSDSVTCMDMYPNCGKCPIMKDFGKDHSFCVKNVTCNAEKVVIGPNDMELAKKLIKAGSEHRKFLRMIHVQTEVRAPRYFWTQLDKYKFVEANSSSTMHLITKRELTRDDFSFSNSDYVYNCLILSELNKNIRHYNDPEWKEHKDEIFMNIKEILPDSYLQRRMIDFNYETALTIYHQRKNHRLPEWKDFCDWIENLPYMQDFLEAVR